MSFTISYRSYQPARILGVDVTKKKNYFGWKNKKGNISMKCDPRKVLSTPMMKKNTIPVSGHYHLNCVHSHFSGPTEE